MPSPANIINPTIGGGFDKPRVQLSSRVTRLARDPSVIATIVVMMRCLVLISGVEHRVDTAGSFPRKKTLHEEKGDKKKKGCDWS